MSLLSLLLFVALWEIVAVWLVHDDTFLPTPVSTAETAVRFMQTPYPDPGLRLWQHALVSTGRILLGWAIGVLIGICLGGMMASVSLLRGLIDPFIELTRPLPPLAFIPLLIVWFGIGETPKLVLIVIGVIPIMTVATAAALDRVPADMVDAARTLGASRAYTLLHVRVRAAAPYILTAMRLSLGVSWTSIVAAEMIVATSGLGYVILQASLFLRTSLIFAGIALIGLLGLGLDLVLRLLSRSLDPAGAAMVSQ
jgi:NitT/TauT family transport system permease protein/taurine transport system permease protein